MSIKPGASIRTHLFLAAMIWTAVGLSLMGFGIYWAYGRLPGWLLAASIIVGSGKSFYVLDRTARKNLSRISQFKDRTCIGAVYSIRMWLLIGGMVIMGRLLRFTAIPLEYIGLLYVTVGWALLLSSRLTWQRWSNCPLS